MTITTTDIRKQEVQILIKYANGGSFTISFKDPTELNGIGVREKYNDTDYEVTSMRLSTLKEEYSWTTDF